MIFAYIMILLSGLAVAFLTNAVLVWLLCWALRLLGIVTIGGWTVAFSWPAVIVFTIVYVILHGIFHNDNNKGD